MSEAKTTKSKKEGPAPESTVTPVPSTAPTTTTTSSPAPSKVPHEKNMALRTTSLSENAEFLALLKEFKALASKEEPTDGYELVQRLISDTSLNPFDVLMLEPGASEEAVKRQHSMVSCSRVQQTRSCARGFVMTRANTSGLLTPFAVSLQI